MRRRVLPLIPLVMLSACREQDERPADPVRPVLSVVVAARAYSPTAHVGTVQPRFSRDLAFRVLGRVVDRYVDVGQPVQAGELLASLDPTALALSVRQLEADLASAEAQLVNARATRERQLALVDRKVNTRADLERADEASAAASGVRDRARADLAKSKEQLSYTRLVSEADGIVTAVGADAGQTVTAGQTVVTVAQDDVREAVVDIPGEIAQEIVEGDAFEATLQVDPSVAATGHVREIAPEIDPSTRTRRVRITLDEPSAAFRIGTTVTAKPKGTGIRSIDLPRTALLEEDGKTFVFVVDAAAGKVVRREVRIGGLEGSQFRIQSGIDAGARVVTAGVHSLKDGQAVKVDVESVP